MREILFRGKRVDNGEWVEVQTIVVIHQDDNDLIFMPQHGEDVKADIMDGNDRALTSIYGNYYQILPETVEQFTGLTDKNGKKIFEDDIIRVKCSIRCPIGVGDSFRIGTYDIDYIASVIFDDCHFGLAKANGEIYEIPLSSENIEVIGNIHENPELLEVTK